MSNLLGGLIPFDNASEIDSSIVVNCNSPVKSADADSNVEILYPTSNDVDYISGDTLPMPSYGGSILKMPAPKGIGCDDEDTIRRVVALESSFKGLKEVLSGVPDEIAAEFSSNTVEKNVTEIKLAVNDVFSKIAASGNTSEMPNLFGLFLAQSSKPDLPKEGPSVYSDRFGRFVYIPIQTLSAVAKLVGDKLGEVRSSVGVTYGSMGQRPFDTTELKDLEDAMTAKLGEGESGETSAAEDLLAALSIDVIGLIMGLLGITNATESPMDIADLACPPLEAATGISPCKELRELTSMVSHGIVPPEFENADDVKKYAGEVLTDITDAQIRDMLLEFFPIYNASTKDITGDSSKVKDLAFFTVYNDTIYLKMPDLTGMDSNGFSEEMYKEDGEISRHLYFELTQKGGIHRSGFQHQPVPCISFSEYESAFPDPDGGEDFTLRLEGDIGKVRAVFLSPVVELSGDITKSAGFQGRVSSDPGIELFTAPLITKPIILGDERKSIYQEEDDEALKDNFDSLKIALGSLGRSESGAYIGGEIGDVFAAKTSSGKLFELEAQDTTGKGLLGALSDAASQVSDIKDEMGGDKARYEAILSDPGAHSDEDVVKASEELSKLGDQETVLAAAEGIVETEAAKIEIDILNIGFPIYKSLQNFEKLEDLLSYKNRHEVLCSDVDGVPKEPIFGKVRRNNANLHKTKFHSSSPLRVSTRPRICGSEHIPALWIKAGELVEDGDNELEATFSKDLFKYFKRKNISFAVYAVDTLGQIFRAPDNYIDFTVEDPDLESASPDGCGLNSMSINSESTEIVLAGTNFRKSIETDGVISFAPEGIGGKVVEISGGDITVNSSERITISSELSPANLNFIPDKYYKIVVKDVLNSVDEENPSESDAYIPIIFSTNETDFKSCPETMVILGKKKIKPRGFKNVIEGVPITQDGTSIEIRLKSPASIFSNGSVMYAYLAFEKSEDNINSVMDNFSFPETRVSAEVINYEGVKTKVFVPYNIEYEFGKGDFKRDETALFFKNKKSILSFPGGDYKNYNFSSLLSVKKCYLLIVADSKITDLGLDADGFKPINEKMHTAVQIGDDSAGKEKGAFSSRPYIVGMFAKTGGAYLQTVGEIGDPAREVIADVFGDARPGFEHKPIDMSSKTMSKLMIIFRGVRHKVLASRQFEIYFNDKKVNSNISGFFKPWTGNGREDEIYVVLKDITAPKEGLFSLYVNNKDPKFYSSGYNGKTLIKEATTADIPIDGNVKAGDLNVGSITIVESDSGTELELSIGDAPPPSSSGLGDGWSGFRAPSSNVGTVMFSELGLPINKADLEYNKSPKEKFNLLRKIPVKSDYKFTVGSDSISDEATDVSSISLTNLYVDKGAKFVWSADTKRSEFFTDKYPTTHEANYARGNVRVSIDDYSAISYGLLVIEAIVAQGETVTNDGSSGQLAVEAIQLASDTLTIQVKNHKATSEYTAGGVRMRVVDAIRTEEDPSVWLVEIGPPNGTLPGVDAWQTVVEDLAKEPCLVVTGTNQNAARVDAIRILGEPAVRNPYGLLRPKTGTINFRFPDFPDPIVPELSLPGNIKLKKPMVPPALIKDICDFSFHLTADLQLSLGNFQILLIPIQCIFRIIDVLCAILNPWKMATALIRLFECLFDLILLIPQLSVPVMFLNLILHLLEIIQCIIEKILWVIKAINVIVPAVKKAAVSPVDWTAIANLENVLSEYLMDIETDLEFLAPISSILGIFLELLQLIFRFPCQINSTGGDFICGLDGTLLAGLARGKAIPAEGSIDVKYLVPVAQAYGDQIGETGTTHMWEEGCGAIADIGYAKAFSGGEVCVSGASNGDFMTIMDPDPEVHPIPDTYRAGNEDYDVTFTVSCTKSSQRGGDPKNVKFLFNSRADPFCIPMPPPINGIPIHKTISYLNPADYPFMLFEESMTSLTTKSEGGFISPIDGYNFLGSDGKIKDLEVTFTWTEMHLNEETGEVEETEVTRTKTFDGVPSLVILDQFGDMYFIDDIEYDGGAVSKIEARVINKDTAERLRFTKEEQTLEHKGDDGKTYETAKAAYIESLVSGGMSEEDAEADAAGRESTGAGDPDFDLWMEKSEDDYSYDVKMFEFPQIYFFDMRRLEDELEEMCTGPNIVDAVLEDAADDDFTDVVQDAKDCIDLFMSLTKEQSRAVYNDLVNGEIPDIIDMDQYALNAQEMIECLEEAASRACKYVISPLTSSFKVLEDDDDTDLEEYVTPDGVDSDILDDHLEGWAETGPDMTGASEYASGDGDSATLMVGEKANIVIVPRDIHNGEVGADFTDKVVLSIVSDSTGTAYFTEFLHEDGNSYFTEKHGNEYRAELNAGAPGVVRIRASICDKTIQALTYAAISKDVYSSATGVMTTEVDCFPDGPFSGTDASDIVSSNFNLTRVDRVLTISYVKSVTVGKSATDAGLTPITSPQAFGTKLEN